MKESNLQKLVMLDCGNEDWIAEHYESKKLLMPNGRYADSGIPVGYPDLTIYPGNGLVCFAELKVGNNKTSDEQDAFIARMSAKGYLCRVIYTMKEWYIFKKFIKDCYGLL